MPEFDVDAYGRSLMARAQEAVVVRRVQVAIGDWTPQANMCHHNVSWFCENSPGYTPIRGWLYFDLSGLAVAKFLSHSVVCAPDGELFDITPWEATQHYPFLHGNLDEDDYAYLVEEKRIGSLHPSKQAA